MSYFVRLVTVLALLPGCNHEHSTEPPVDDTDTSDESVCTTDDACGPGRICDEGACVDGDRSNGFDEAEPVFQEQPVDGVINPEGDVDYYAYTSVGDEWLRIETTPDERGEGQLDTVVAVYNAGGGLHAWIDDYPTGNVSNYDSVLYVYLPTPGVWYVTVQDGSSFYADATNLLGGPDFTYTLNLKSFTRLTSETDSPEAPSVDVDVADDSTIYAVGVNLGAPGDSDYIQVDLPIEGGPFEIYGNPDIPGSAAKPRLDVYDPDGARILRKDGIGGDDGYGLYFDTHVGSYVVEATDQTGNGGADDWYVLYFRTHSPDYYNLEVDVEPNDAADASQTLTTYADQTSSGKDYDQANVTGFLDPDGDQDFFTVDASADDYVTVWCTSDAFGSELDPKLEVFGPDGASLGSASDGTDSAPDVTNLGPLTSGGPVTVQIAAEGGVTSGPSAYYYCSIFLTPFEVSN